MTRMACDQSDQIRSPFHASNLGSFHGENLDTARDKSHCLQLVGYTQTFESMEGSKRVRAIYGVI